MASVADEEVEGPEDRIAGTEKVDNLSITVACSRVLFGDIFSIASFLPPWIQRCSPEPCKGGALRTLDCLGSQPELGIIELLSDASVNKLFIVSVLCKKLCFCEPSIHPLVLLRFRLSELYLHFRVCPLFTALTVDLEVLHELGRVCCFDLQG